MMYVPTVIAFFVRLCSYGIHVSVPINDASSCIRSNIIENIIS